MISANAIINKLLYVTPNRKLLYVTDINSMSDSVASHKLEHLSCFLPGLLALGAHTIPMSPGDKERHKWAAKGLATTCYMTYHDQPSGLGPDTMHMASFNLTATNRTGLWVEELAAWEHRGRKGAPPGLQPVKQQPAAALRDYSQYFAPYLLRPETVESLYLMWRTTGDPIWRERGWDIFRAINDKTRTTYGFASAIDVDAEDVQLEDSMPRCVSEVILYL